MQAFQELDLYAIDGLYSEEERLVRDSVRRFVDDRVLPIIEVQARDLVNGLHRPNGCLSREATLRDGATPPGCNRLYTFGRFA